ncbi:MAG: hypothetical protein VXV86_04850, partial [Verrucomicrobiota bacterium]|nr:hypothetical protein [Verrucomicrobiota bacterium]
RDIRKAALPYVLHTLPVCLVSFLSNKWFSIHIRQPNEELEDDLDAHGELQSAKYHPSSSPALSEKRFWGSLRAFFAH